MSPQPAQLAALVAIVEHGTFEAAARAAARDPERGEPADPRHWSPMAGQVLVRRTSPCRATAAGRACCSGSARQTSLLYDEAARRLAAATADRSSYRSRSTPTRWRPGSAGCSATVASGTEVALRLHVEDQAYSAGLLRRGDVLAAVTSRPGRRPGLRGRAARARCATAPAATPGVRRALAARAGHGLGADAGRWCSTRRTRSSTTSSRPRGRPPPSRAPGADSADFHEAVRLGLGWAAIPKPQLDPDLESGRLVLLLGRARHVDVLLHWQRWRLDSPLLARLTDAVRTAARAHLR